MRVPLPDWGVTVFESRHGQGFFGQLHDDFAKFLLLLSGEAVWNAAGRTLRLGPNSLVHIPAGLTHDQRDLPGNPVTLYAVHYRPGVLPSRLSEALTSLGMVCWNLGEEGLSLRAFRSDLREMLFEQATRREGWEEVVRGCFSHLAVRALRLHRRHSSGDQAAWGAKLESRLRVANYLRKMESTFYRQQTLEEAAASAGLSRRHFTEIFRKLSGETWHRHLERLRLNHARRLLTETDSSVLAVTFECGFENPSNFHRVFKRAFGCSPNAIREQPDPLRRRVKPTLDGQRSRPG